MAAVKYQVDNVYFDILIPDESEVDEAILLASTLSNGFLVRKILIGISHYDCVAYEAVGFLSSYGAQFDEQRRHVYKPTNNNSCVELVSVNLMNDKPNQEEEVMSLIKDVYKYKLEEDYVYYHPLLKGSNLFTKWMTIIDGTITIKKGYAWNGCSPNMVVLGIFEFGTPDGALREGKPWTYYASLIHDALTQYRMAGEYSRIDSIVIFGDMLKEVKFPLTKVYVFFLKIFFRVKFAGD